MSTTIYTLFAEFDHDGASPIGVYTREHAARAALATFAAAEAAHDLVDALSIHRTACDAPPAYPTIADVVVRVRCTVDRADDSDGVPHAD